MHERSEGMEKAAALIDQLREVACECHLSVVVAVSEYCEDGMDNTTLLSTVDADKDWAPEADHQVLDAFTRLTAAWHNHAHPGATVIESPNMAER